MTAADPIVRVEAVDAVLPLPQTLQLGPMTISERRYAVVTVTTESGLTGHAIALSRDAPVSTAVNGLLAGAVVGCDASRIGEAWERMFKGSIASGRVGVILRALSLVDIALWDVLGQRAGLPVWQLLGGARPDAQVMMVGGYPRSDVAPEAVGERVAAYSQDGYDLVKIARSHDNDVTRRILRRAVDGLRAGGRVVVDAAWAYPTSEQVVRDVAAWGDVPLAWLEDPIAPENVTACARLARLLPAPVGYGDEITDEHLLARLVEAEAMRVVRVDATTIGGITGAVRAVGMATLAGLPVSFHVYPEIHVHLAQGLRGSLSCETFDPVDNPFDPCSDLLVGGPAIAAGRAAAPDAPGLGFALDAERLASAAVHG